MVLPSQCYEAVFSFPEIEPGDEARMKDFDSVLCLPDFAPLSKVFREWVIQSYVLLSHRGSPSLMTWLWTQCIMLSTLQRLDQIGYGSLSQSKVRTYMYLYSDSWASLNEPLMDKE